MILCINGYFNMNLSNVYASNAHVHVAQCLQNAYIIYTHDETQGIMNIHVITLNTNEKM